MRVRSTEGDWPASLRYTPEMVRIWLACRPYTFFQGVGDLSDGGFGAGGVHGEFQQVAVAVAVGGAGEGVECVLAGGLVAFRAQPSQLFDLLGAYGGVVDLQDLDLLVGRGAVLVHADHGLAAGVDAGLGAGRGLLHAQFGDAGVDGLGHAAGLFDFLDVLPGPPRQVVGQLLDVGAAAPGVDDPCGAGLLLDEQLGVAGDAGGEVGGQGEGLVEGVGVQRLGVALGGRQRLHAGAGDVVEHVLRGQ
ncbi:hypothetical protein GCM10020295_75970 [Streptomyces cinereospinus]